MTHIGSYRRSPPRRNSLHYAVALKTLLFRPSPIYPRSKPPSTVSSLPRDTKRYIRTNNLSAYRVSSESCLCPYLLILRTNIRNYTRTNDSTYILLRLELLRSLRYRTSRTRFLQSPFRASSACVLNRPVDYFRIFPYMSRKGRILNPVLLLTYYYRTSVFRRLRI